MRQFELVAPKTFEKHEVPIPEPGPGEVRIAVKSVGICGSDIHAYYGKHPFMSFPIVLGHECAGVVEKLGEGVTKVALGRSRYAENAVPAGKADTISVNL